MDTFELFGTRPTEDLWRYTTLAKLLSMIEGPDKMELVAIQAQKFEDDYEGTLSTNALAKLQAMILNDDYTNYLDDWGAVQNQYPKAVRGDIKATFYDGAEKNTGSERKMIDRMRQITFANCWNVGEYEDSNMWGAYTTQTDGVVIKSDFDSLQNSLQPTDGKLFAGTVEYIDFETDDMENRAIAPFFYKKREFRTESEFRLVLTDFTKDKLDPNEGVSSMPSVSDQFRHIELDTTDFIDEIRVHPKSSPYLKEVVEDSLGEKDVAIPVTESSLTPNLS